MKKERKLTEKEKLFCREYLVDLNATQAAQRAGWKKSSSRQTGYRMLTRGYIQQYLANLIAKRVEKLDISADYVLSTAKELVERCMQRVPVMVRKGKGFAQLTERVEHEDGTVTDEGVWKFDSKGVALGLRMLGEHLALFKTVHANDPDNPMPSNVTIIKLPSNGREK